MSARVPATAPPESPELPDAARPRWPPWLGFAAMGAGTLAVLFLGIPILPAILLTETDGAVGALALLAALVVQDATFVGAAVFLASRRGRPRPWHFGIRPSPPRRTILIAVLVALLLFGFEVGYIELLGVDESNTEDLGGESGVLAALALSGAVIVVAPVTEEIFFRGFFYRALRTRLRVWLAAPINGLIFGSLHFQGLSSLEILPVIAVFGIGVCLVYEATASIFAVIAIHAAFNTFAVAGTDVGVLVPLLVGLAVVAVCVVVPVRLRAAPSPFPRRVATAA
ncbi:MAG: CPBP family intramembrane glutamic endopeptidase [Thermoleophilaceae bacterium]